MPAHVHRLIKASAFPSVFKFKRRSSMGYFALSVTVPNQYDSIKYLTMDKKKEKKKDPQVTESEDELPRVSPSEPGLQIFFKIGGPK